MRASKPCSNHLCARRRPQHGRDSRFGLGLSIARAIVLAHGGELSLNDRQPHGLIVRIELPVHQQGRLAAA